MRGGGLPGAGASKRGVLSSGIAARPDSIARPRNEARRTALRSLRRLPGLVDRGVEYLRDRPFVREHEDVELDKLVALLLVARGHARARRERLACARDAEVLHPAADVDPGAQPHV